VWLVTLFARSLLGGLAAWMRPRVGWLFADRGCFLVVRDVAAGMPCAYLCSGTVGIRNMLVVQVISHIHMMICKTVCALHMDLLRA